MNGLACATTLREVSFTEAVSQSELIFQGIVVSTHSGTSPNSGRPFTYFTFRILEVLKGTYTEPTITLGFLGGVKDGYALIVSGMRMPETGERGIYFVESLSRQQVHPLYGWHQWHLLVDVDTDGIESVVPVAARKRWSKVAPPLEQIKRDIRSVTSQAK